jgi:hypothetical protein
MKKLNDFLEKLDENSEMVSLKSLSSYVNNPVEGFVRVLVHLYRDPKKVDAMEIANNLKKAFGEKEVSTLLARAKEVVEMLSGEEKNETR